MSESSLGYILLTYLPWTKQWKEFHELRNLAIARFQKRQYEIYVRPKMLMSSLVSDGHTTTLVESTNATDQN